MLTKITAGVWTVEARFTAPGMSLPLRMTVLRLADGGLLLYSPVPLDADTADAIEALGEVRHIVAPSLLHHLHAGPAADRFSSATLWGPAGLRKKRADLTGLAVLPEDSPFPGVSMVHVQGAPWLSEVCLLHEAGSALLCADLFFNVRDVGGWFGGVFTAMTGTNNRLAMSRSWNIFSSDKAKTAESIEQIMAWNADRALMGHGVVLLEGATAQLQAVILPRLRRPADA